jgi:transcriptional regulator with XRE-family HTH domain
MRRRILRTMDVLERILEIAESRGLGQLELERLAGLPTNRISKYKSGQGRLTVEHAARMASVLGVSLDTLSPPPPAAPLPDDDAELLLRVWKALGISADEAVRRLSAGGPGERKGD